MPGWEGSKQLHSDYRPSKPSSPGDTEEQRVEVARFRAELLELSAVVSTHAFWAQVERGDLVQARMALKHAHEEAAGEGVVVADPTQISRLDKLLITREYLRFQLQRLDEAIRDLKAQEVRDRHRAEQARADQGVEDPAAAR